MPLLILAVFLFMQKPAFALSDTEAVTALLCEAQSEGRIGMQAVGEVIRKRNSLSGFSCLKRKDLDEFIDNTPDYVREWAIKAWRDSEHSSMTKGATHYENVKAFGVPWWAHSMTEVTQIGNHTFYKE